MNKVNIIRRNGRLHSRHNWTEEEKDYIRVHYKGNSGSLFRLSQKFEVTVEAIKKMVSKYGLVKSKNLWTQKQEAYLRENFNKLPTPTIARELGKSEASVRGKTQRLRLMKNERVEWFTLTEVCHIIGICRERLLAMINDGYRLDVRSFNPDRPLGDGSGTPYYISRESLKSFIRRFPEELNGRNVDMVVIVDVLAGIETGIADIRECYEDDTEEKTEEAMV